MTTPVSEAEEKEVVDLFLDDDIAEAFAWKAARDEEKKRSPFGRAKALFKGA